MSHPLVLPMLLQMFLAVFILFWLAYGRVTTIKKLGGVKALRDAGGFNKKLINRSDNFTNQFELPVVFYALCLLFIIAGPVSGAVVAAAWVFVISRIIHTFIQTTNNVIFPNRFFVFLIGALSLITMLVIAITKAL